MNSHGRLDFFNRMGARVVAYLLRLIFASVLMLSSVANATITGTSAWTMLSSTPLLTYSSATNACNGYYSRNIPYAGAASSDFNHVDVSGSSGTCYWGKSGVCTTCYTGTVSQGAYQCPAGSTYSGGSCTCNAGYTESADHLSCQSTGCPTAGTKFSGYTYGTSYSVAYATASANTCATYGGLNCAYSAPTLTLLPDLSQNTLVSGVVNHTYAVSYAWTGATCTGPSSLPSTSPPASTCAAGQFLATVNGISKCYNSAGTVTASADDQSAKATNTTTNNTVTNADGSKTVTTTVTNNVTGASYSYNTTYASGVTPPVVPASQTTLDQSGKDVAGSMAQYCAQNPTSQACQTTDAVSQYCAAHPNSTMCKDKNISSGTDNGCTVQPTCASPDDPAACVAIYEQWKGRCNVENEINNSTYKNLADDANPVGTTTEQAAASSAKAGTTTNLSDAFTAAHTSYLTFTGTCSPSFSFEVRGQTFTVDMSWLCPIGIFIKLLMHMAAYMVVIRMFLSFSTGKGA